MVKLTNQHRRDLLKLFTMVAGIILILSSVPAFLIADLSLIEQDAELISVASNRVIVGQFISGVLPILW